MVAYKVSILSTGGQNYVRIWGLHQTSLYIPLRPLPQFNVLQSISALPWDFSTEPIEGDVCLTLRMVAMW